MNKRAWIAAVCVLVLTACASQIGLEPFAIMRTSGPDVLVSVVNGAIDPQPDPIRFPIDKKNVWVIWEIRDPASGWRFNHHSDPKPGIFIRTPTGDIVNCHWQARGVRFACFNIHKFSGEYKYDVNLHGPAPLSKDPILIND